MDMRNMIKASENESFAMEHLISDPKTVVVGCGGAGNNSVDRLTRIGVWGAETIALNTDRAHLERVHADKRVLIGKRITHGQGSGGHPEVAEHCAEEAREELEILLKGADITFITAGMGGGTGTGTAPIVAEVAKEMGSVVVSMATVPFTVEGNLKCQRAAIGMEKLKKNSDSTIILANDKLLKMAPKLPINQAFSVMDQMISEVIKEITEAVTQPSLINLDFADLRTVMGSGGTSTVLYGENSASDPLTVVAEALDNPLVDVNYVGATSALIHITSGPEMSLRTATRVVQGFTDIMDPNANVIWGARTDPKFSGQLKVMAVMNGVEMEYQALPSVEMNREQVQMACIPLVR
ncbi:MAG: cell division protein FtsZ [Thermoplasmata archaeon]|nr:cell division protein FtsZ [Thermoplasmata archaeon]